MGSHLFALGEALLEAAIEGVGAGRLDSGKAGHGANEGELMCLAEGFADGGGVAKIACRKDKPVRSLPGELLQYLKADSFLSFNAKWIEGVKQVDTQLATDLFNQVHGGLGFGFLQHSNIDPTAGLRFRF